jgi:nucleosome binding factor SPN SPT16 subunit
MKIDGKDVHVPFHIQTIKNSSLKTDGGITFLRINFHVPG